MNIGSTLKAAKIVVTSTAGRTLLKGQKNSPVLLFGAGVIGVVTTTVMASKATLRLEDEILNPHERKTELAKDLLASKNENYTPSDYTKDMTTLKARFVMDIAKLYGPTIVVGTLSICALGGSHVILTRRNTGLMAAYAALDKGYNEYRARVREAVGDEKERELRFGVEEREIAVDTDKGTKVETIRTAPIHGASEYARFFSKETSNAWEPQPEYNLVFLRSVMTFANDRLEHRGHVFLNEIYDDLGMERTKAGAVVGWVFNNPKGVGDNRIDFGIFDNPDRFHDFVTGREGAILLDFNVDGVVYDLI